MPKSKPFLLLQDTLPILSPHKSKYIMSAYKIIDVFLVESYFKSYFNHTNAEKAIETKIAVKMKNQIFICL